MLATRNAILMYLTELNFKWFNSWEGFRSPKFNKYMPGTKMTEHCDHISDLFDGTRKGIPILTAVGLLNDNFEGGDFVMFQNEKYELTKGDIILFPANFVYPHLVDTVTSGIRYSYASWVW
jgi:predicted 2-oxoglutarate/Fe(II)-dependent dioxygenase YbiX